ncbi:maltoporin LamB [Vibrio metschnikovii]|uniref:Maltoporin LamB n=2 Tax=Unclassified Bacteria TaxID=49928 RepID=A0AAU6UVY3_UNCXX|nr:maltoporin LamB [Vibrio metschnikovii]EKO3591231.1 maltoporin LamB [Vibrio metschnikovii]EKO3621694.1 maltoporin LamB [Vibrio metschnikovii]EKO3624820.1 maltoporin LamB [Vibrio metschnikovii]EKO3648163.1 maltoporin LamB [Vibrio metschnikovii]
MKKVSVIAAAVAASLAAGSAFAVDFNGYMRAGTAISNHGTGDQAFEKNGVGRLGNEDDNYYEFGFAKELKTGEQTWKVESMIASSDEGKSGWESKEINVAQFNVQAKGLFASDPDAVLWAGKRYYQRKDIHITDFYFLNTSGTGGGIENVSIGDQKLSVALIQDGAHENSTGYIFDARLANIGVWDNASLELAVAYNFATDKDNVSEQADDGVLLSAILHQGLSNGFNQTILQYGTNGYGKQVADFGSGAWYDRSTSANNDASAFRLINWGVVSLGERWEVGHQLAYMNGSDIPGYKKEKDKDDVYTGKNLDINQYSAVVRPMYKWNDTMRTVFEAGYHGGKKIADDGLSKEDFGHAKLTVAQAWAMGDSFWSRPELRVYGSYLHDTKNDDSFGTGNDSEFVVGVQVEAWW